jgi:hypothetical protein
LGLFLETHPNVHERCARGLYFLVPSAFQPMYLTSGSKPFRQPILLIQYELPESPARVASSDAQLLRILGDLLPQYKTLSKEGGLDAAWFATSTAVRMLPGSLRSVGNDSRIQAFQVSSKGSRASDVRGNKRAYTADRVYPAACPIAQRVARTAAAQVYQALGSYLEQGLGPVKYEGLPCYQKWSCCS